MSLKHLMSRAVIEETQSEPKIEKISTENHKDIQVIKYKEELATEGIWSNFINKYKSEDTLIKNKIKDINLKKSCKAIISYESLIAYDKFIKELLKTHPYFEDYKALYNYTTVNALNLKNIKPLSDKSVFLKYKGERDVLTSLGNSCIWGYIKSELYDGIDNLKDIVTSYDYYFVPWFNILTLNNKTLTYNTTGIEMSIVNFEKGYFDIESYGFLKDFKDKCHIYVGNFGGESVELDLVNLDDKEIFKIYEFIKNFKIENYKFNSDDYFCGITGKYFTFIDDNKYYQKLVTGFINIILSNYYSIIKRLLKNIDNNTDTNKFIKEGYNMDSFTTESYNTLVNELQNYNINYNKDRLAFAENRIEYANELSMECYKFKLDKEIHNWNELATEGIGDALKKAGKFIIEKIKQFIEWIKKVFFNKKEKINKDIKIIESKGKETEVISSRAEKINNKFQNTTDSINDKINQHIEDIKKDKEKYKAEIKKSEEIVKNIGDDVEILEKAAKDLEKLLANKTIEMIKNLDLGILSINKELASFYSLKAKLLSILLNTDPKSIFTSNDIKKDTVAVHLIELLDKIDEKTISNIRLPDFKPSEGDYKKLSDNLKLFKSTNLITYAKVEFNMLDAHKEEITNFLSKLKEDDPLVKEAKTIITSFTSASKNLEIIVNSYLELCKSFDRAREDLKHYKFTEKEEQQIFDATIKHEVSW